MINIICCIFFNLILSDSRVPEVTKDRVPPAAVVVVDVPIEVVLL